MAANNTSKLPEFTSSHGVLRCNGRRINIKGVNWFGVEGTIFNFAGLWQVSFDRMVRLLRDNNFNAVRIPITLIAIEEMDIRTPGAMNPDPDPDVPGDNKDFINIKLDQLLDRAVQRFAAAGILVMFEMHQFVPLPPSGGAPIPEVWYEDPTFPEDRVIRGWQKLARRYAQYWNVFAADLKNEPHGRASWGDGNMATDWAAAAERIGNAILDVCPRLLIFVEGIEGVGTPDSRWGGHFTQIEARNRPVKLKVPNRLVYSPHVYGPSIWPKPLFGEWNFPQNMPQHWIEQWAFLKASAQYGNAALCLGEWGGRCTDTMVDQEDNQWEGKVKGFRRMDLAWHRALAEFLALNDIRDTFYWALNNNCGHTGGLLANDWITLDQNKMQIINFVCPNPTRFVNGVPNTPTTQPPPRPWPTALPGLRPMPLPAGAPTNNPPKPPVNNPPKPPVNNPVNNQPGTPPKPNPPKPNPPSNVPVEVKTLSTWSEGSETVFRCDVIIKNPGKGSLLGARFRIQEVEKNSRITQLWGMTQSGEVWMFPSHILDQGGLKPGATHQFGCVAKGTKPPVFNAVTRG